MKAVEKNAARIRSNKAQTKTTANRKAGRITPRITPRIIRRMAALRNMDNADRQAVALVDVLAEHWGISRAAVIPRIIQAVKREG